MLKQHYIDLQKKVLEDNPLNPYELTKAGIGELRKNIILSLMAFGVMCISTWCLFVWGLRAADNETASTFFRIGQFCAPLFVLFISARIFGKSSDYLVMTGLWWRISVWDEFQDEWENAQKHKANSRSFDCLFYTLLTVFVLWLIYAFVRSLPPPPSFGISIIIGFVSLYAIGVMPLAFTAWSLEPIEDGEHIKRPLLKRLDDDKTEMAPKVILTPKQKWRKRLWDWFPYFVGIGVAILLTSRNKNTVFYEWGHDIGNWIGRLVGGG